MILAQLRGIGRPQAASYFVARDTRNAAGIVRISISLVTKLVVFFSIAYAAGLLLLVGPSGSISTLDGALSVCLVSLLLFQSLSPATLLGLASYTSFNLA